MDFIGLKVIGVVIVVGGLVYLYRKYKDQTTLDDIFTAQAEKLYQKMVAHVDSKIKDVEGYDTIMTATTSLREKAQADLDKAKALAEKVKTIIG